MYKTKSRQASGVNCCSAGEIPPGPSTSHKMKLEFEPVDDGHRQNYPWTKNQDVD